MKYEFVSFLFNCVVLTGLITSVFCSSIAAVTMSLKIKSLRFVVK